MSKDGSGVLGPDPVMQESSVLLTQVFLKIVSQLLNVGILHANPDFLLP